MKLVKIIKHTQLYVIVGEADSSSEQYWEKDFQQKARIALGKLEIEIVEALRPMSDVEEAIFNNFQPASR